MIKQNLHSPSSPNNILVKHEKYNKLKQRKAEKRKSGQWLSSSTFLFCRNYTIIHSLKQSLSTHEIKNERTPHFLLKIDMLLVVGILQGTRDDFIEQCKYTGIRISNYDQEYHMSIPLHLRARSPLFVVFLAQYKWVFSRSAVLNLIWRKSVHTWLHNWTHMGSSCWFWTHWVCIFH